MTLRARPFQRYVAGCVCRSALQQQNSQAAARMSGKHAQLLIGVGQTGFRWKQCTQLPQSILDGAVECLSMRLAWLFSQSGFGKCDRSSATRKNSIGSTASVGSERD